MSTASDATFIETTWKNVAMKSNFALQTDCCGWIIHEKKCTVLVIIHIAEIAKRSIHLDEGFSSLYDYCRIKLQLSEGETYLRTQVAGVCSKHPELLAALFRGDISLSVAGKLSAHLTTENKQQLLAKCKGKSKREVETLLAADQPRPLPAPELRACSVEMPIQPEVKAPLFHVSAAAPDSPAPAREFPATAPVREISTVHILRCALTEATKEKLLRLAEVLGIDNPIANVAILLDRALEIALKAKDPAAKKATTRTSTKKSADCAPSAEAAKETNVRTLPISTKRLVLARAGYQCEFTGTSGRRCTSRTHLEIDHRHALFLGGSHEISNLQVLCSSHHSQKSEQEFGRKWQKSPMT